MPTSESFLKTLNELQCDISIVTETWFTPTDKVSKCLEDLNEKDGFGCVRWDRPGERPAGGVAIFYRNSVIQMTWVKIPPSDFELVAALGRRAGQRRKILVLALYIPPWYDAEMNAKCLDHTNGVLKSLRNKYHDPSGYKKGHKWIR